MLESCCCRFCRYSGSQVSHVYLAFEVLVCICIGQQAAGATPDPTPALSPSPDPNRVTLPTAPLGSLPINFGSASNANATATAIPPVAAVGAQSPEPAAAAAAPSPAAQGNVTEPLLSPASNLTLPNTPIEDLPISFRFGAIPAGR